MTAVELMAKATRAAESARLLLEAGDLDGACNRAYYVMFDAARAVAQAIAFVQAMRQAFTSDPPGH